MSPSESIVEDAALDWFRELSYAIRHGPHLAPGEAAAERDSVSEMLLVGCLREAIPQPNSAISSRALVALRHTLLSEVLSGEMSVAAADRQIT